MMRQIAKKKENHKNSFRTLEKLVKKKKYRKKSPKLGPTHDERHNENKKRQSHAKDAVTKKKLCRKCDRENSYASDEVSYSLCWREKNTHK